MTDYSPPLEDILFALRNFAMLGELAGHPQYEHADYETVSTVAAEFGRFFSEVWAPTNVPGDREGLTWSEDGVKVPESFHPAWEKYVAAGWQGLNLDPEYGGMGFPEVIYSLLVEIVSSANAAFAMLPGLNTGAVECLTHWGTEEQKEVYVRQMISGKWSGTMNLTEPQAGTDVGLSTSRATPNDDGSYRVVGTKIFISFGEHDLTENIVHLVLARTPDSPPGTKGISLFLVPKFLPGPNGEVGERNDVRCVSIEQKMGIHSSPTCVMSFGDSGGATGWLVGEENQGMRAMFTMMNAARLAVAVQATGIAEVGYQKAVAYARERVQGTEVGGTGTGPAPLIVHPDVRRMLITMRAHIEANRNLATHAAACLDMSRVTEGEESERWRESLELLTPVAKAWCSDVGVQVSSIAVQVFGGMGYIEEAGVSQHLRDQRITPIYEGTNGVQAMDLVGRKLGLRMGGVFADLMAEMRVDLASLAGVDGFAGAAASLAAALDQLQVTTDWIMSNGLAEPRDALAGATPYLEMFGLCVGGWLMARQALAATSELSEGQVDEAFLRAKVTTARFFCEQILPKAHALAPSVMAGHEVLYEIEDVSLSSS